MPCLAYIRGCPRSGSINRITCNIIDVLYSGAPLVDHIIPNTLYIPVRNPKKQRLNKSPISLLARFWMRLSKKRHQL